MSEVIEAFKPKCPVEGWVQCINCIYHKKMESYDMCDFEYHPVNAHLPHMCVHYVQKNPTPTVDGFIKANVEILAIAEMKRIVEEAESNREYKGFTKEQLSEMKKIIDEEFNRLIGGEDNDV